MLRITYFVIDDMALRNLKSFIDVLFTLMAVFLASQTRVPDPVVRRIIQGRAALLLFVLS